MSTNVPGERYRTRLQADFPNLQIDKIELIGEGWDHAAVQVNDSIIFRIPRGTYNNEKLATSTAYETAILRILRGKLPVQIPDPLFIAPNNAYFGYPMLPGVIEFNSLPTFTTEDNEHLRKDWVATARSIHQGISVDQAEQLGVPRFNPAGVITTSKEVYGLVELGQPMRAFIDRVIDEASGINIDQEHLAFIHGDLHLLNILANPLTKRITGVIDWTDCCIAPLAREFAIWAWSYDAHLEVVVDLYEKESGVRVDVNQARLWKYLDEIADLVEQTKSGDAEGAQHSLEHMRKWITQGN